ncbi:MAG: hypothetical protein AABX01_03785 [Candidatus Micrarchaeota archaeon]
MRKITVVFSETALELAPSEIASSHIIQQEATKRHMNTSNILLDSNKHNLPMRALPDAQRRGRPDILHFSLLTALESIANKRHQIESVFAHTPKNQLLEFSTQARLPRIYNRFCGIMEQVLSGKGNELIKVKNDVEFSQFFDDLVGASTKKPAPSIYFFNELGKNQTIKLFASSLTKALLEKNDFPIIFVFGCFPHGTFSPEIRNYLLSKKAQEVKFGDELLPVWTLVSTAINAYELEAGL